jgi:3-hydroxyisobutyrate dehydrogenase
VGFEFVDFCGTKEIELFRQGDAAMKTIGFIGLGVMGEPMAANLLRKGYSVTVYNRTPGKADELTSLGANVADSPMETARASQVIITMISNDQAIEEVYYGEKGVLAGVRAGSKIGRAHV